MGLIQEKAYWGLIKEMCVWRLMQLFRGAFRNMLGINSRR